MEGIEHLSHILVSFPTLKLLSRICPLQRPHRKSGDRLYFEFFRVQPMELCVTLRVNTHSRSGDRGSAAKSVYRYTRAAGFPILNLERACMPLISFELYDEFVSRDDFMLKLSFFYAAQAVFQLCKVGGGIEGLQPAASIVYGIGSGVRSFFYEPARYICMNLYRHWLSLTQCANHLPCWLVFTGELLTRLINSASALAGRSVALSKEHKNSLRRASVAHLTLSPILLTRRVVALLTSLWTSHTHTLCTQAAFV